MEPFDVLKFEEEDLSIQKELLDFLPKIRNIETFTNKLKDRGIINLEKLYNFIHKENTTFKTFLNWNDYKRVAHKVILKVERDRKLLFVVNKTINEETTPMLISFKKNPILAEIGIGYFPMWTNYDRKIGYQQYLQVRGKQTGRRKETNSELQKFHEELRKKLKDEYGLNIPEDVEVIKNPQTHQEYFDSEEFIKERKELITRYEKLISSRKVIFIISDRYLSNNFKEKLAVLGIRKEFKEMKVKENNIFSKQISTINSFSKARNSEIIMDRSKQNILKQVDRFIIDILKFWDEENYQFLNTITKELTDSLFSYWRLTSSNISVVSHNWEDFRGG